MNKLNIKNITPRGIAQFCLRIAVYVIISFVFALCVYRWNAQTLAGNRLPMPFGRGMAVVLSGSMEPELYVNDLVFVKATDSYEVDDIVVYQSGNILIIHRIIEISPDGTTIVTRGDANNIADDPIDVSAIKGKMTGKIRGVGGIINVLRSPLVLMMLGAVAIALLVLSGRSEKTKPDDKTAAVREEIRQLKEELAKLSDESDDGSS